MGCSDTALNVSEEIIRDSLASPRVSLNQERAMCPRDGCAVVFSGVFPEVLILQENCTDGLVPPAFGWMFCVTNSRTAGAPGWLRSGQALAGLEGFPRSQDWAVRAQDTGGGLSTLGRDLRQLGTGRCQGLSRTLLLCLLAGVKK